MVSGEGKTEKSHHTNVGGEGKIFGRQEQSEQSKNAEESASLM